MSVLRILGYARGLTRLFIIMTIYALFLLSISSSPVLSRTLKVCEGACYLKKPYSHLFRVL